MIPALIVVLSGVCNWACWRMLRTPFAIHAPDFMFDVPDYTLDTRGLT